MCSLPMPERTRDDAALAAARLRGKRIALGLVLLPSLWIIASSAAQIIPPVFGADIRPIPAALPGSSARTCAEGVQSLERALDRAVDVAGSGDFVARLKPEWDQRDVVEQACSHSSEGLDAWAALARLRAAEEWVAPGARERLAPLRRDVGAHLPADLR
jgi:hypothetical protein